MLRKLNQLTRFQGVMNRKDYWFYLFIEFVISGLNEITKIGFMQITSIESGGTLLNFLALAVRAFFVVAMLIVLFCAIVRRLHDINLTGYIALLFIPAAFISQPLTLAMLVILGIVPPRHANNKYLNQ